MRPVLLALLLLAVPMVVDAQIVNNATVGAEVVFRTPPPPTAPSMKIEIITDQNSYPFPFVSAFIRFGYALDAHNIFIGVPPVGPAVDGVREWYRHVQNFAVSGGPLTEIVVVVNDSAGGQLGRTLLCTPDPARPERRLVCRGGPQP